MSFRDDNMNVKGGAETAAKVATETAAEPNQATTFEGPGDAFIQSIYGELRQLADAKMRRFHAHGYTLQPTALVHEAYMRLMKNPDKVWKGRRHFYGAVALAMRHILIERIRARMADKRGGGWKRVDVTISLADEDDALMLSPEAVLTLEGALVELQREYPELVEIVLIRYFCGLTVPEIAALLAMSERSVARKWTFARAWLQKRLLDEATGASG